MRTLHKERVYLKIVEKCQRRQRVCLLGAIMTGFLICMTTSIWASAVYQKGTLAMMWAYMGLYSSVASFSVIVFIIVHLVVFWDDAIEQSIKLFEDVKESRFIELVQPKDDDTCSDIDPYIPSSNQTMQTQTELAKQQVSMLEIEESLRSESDLPETINADLIQSPENEDVSVASKQDLEISSMEVTILADPSPESKGEESKREISALKDNEHEQSEVTEAGLLKPESEGILNMTVVKAFQNVASTQKQSEESDYKDTSSNLGNKSPSDVFLSPPDKS